MCKVRELAEENVSEHLVHTNDETSDETSEELVDSIPGELQLAE